MLRLWRDRNYFRLTENELKAILLRALDSVVPVQIEAIEELNNDANQVPIDSDVRGDAVVMQVSGEDFAESVRLGVDICPNSTQNSAKRGVPLPTMKTATFTSAKGAMFCNDCDDCLHVAAGAVPDGETYTVTMDSAPCFICEQHISPDGYYLCAVKEFTEMEQRHFKSHVKIFMNYSLDSVNVDFLTNNDLRIRYSTVDNKHYAVADYVAASDVEQQLQSLPQVFYTYEHNTIIIYTKHFTTFKYESKSWFRSNCKATRQVRLVADVYGRNVCANNTLELSVYIRDDLDERKSDYLASNTEREQSNGRQKLQLYNYLNNLPSSVGQCTKFECYLRFRSEHWKEYDLAEELECRVQNLDSYSSSSESGSTKFKSVIGRDVLPLQPQNQRPFDVFILKNIKQQNSLEAVVNIPVEDDESNSSTRESFFTSTFQINTPI